MRCWKVEALGSRKGSNKRIEKLINEERIINLKKSRVICTLYHILLE
jgi:hypothetical protein